MKSHEDLELIASAVHGGHSVAYGLGAVYHYRKGNKLECVTSLLLAIYHINAVYRHLGRI